MLRPAMRLPRRRLKRERLLSPKESAAVRCQHCVTGAAVNAGRRRRVKTRTKKAGSSRTPAINEDDLLLEEVMAVASAEIEARLTQLRDA